MWKCNYSPAGWGVLSKPFLPTDPVDELDHSWMHLGTQRNISGAHLGPAVVTEEHFGPPQDISLFEASMWSKFRAVNNNPQRRESFEGCTIPSFCYVEHWRENLTHFEKNEFQEFPLLLGTAPASGWGIYFPPSLAGPCSCRTDLAMPKMMHSHSSQEELNAACWVPDPLP